MPDLIKKLRYDDGEAYWYPATIQTEHSFVFPAGTVALAGEDGSLGKNQIKWCWAPVSKLTLEEKKVFSEDIDYESKLDMEKAEYFLSYLEACKKVKGFSLGDM